MIYYNIILYNNQLIYSIYNNQVIHHNTKMLQCHHVRYLPVCEHIGQAEGVVILLREKL